MSRFRTWNPRRRDGATGLPLNADGTVSVFHGTTAARAAGIVSQRQLRADAEPDVYVTTARGGTGYGDGTVVQLDVDPRLLVLDDEFPNGRRDFRLRVGRGRSLSCTKARLL